MREVLLLPLITRLANLITKTTWETRLSLTLVLLLAVGWIDFVTGYESSLAIFYGLPIGLAVALCGKRAAFLISVLAALTWYWADVAAGHQYRNPAIHALEICLRVAFFLSIVVAGAALKAHEKAITARIDLLEQLRRCEKQIVEVSEHEQQRIGQDLHDGICQYFAALAWSASSLQQELEKNSLAEFAKTAGEIAQSIREGVIRTRDLARGLTPVQSAEGGLVLALDELTKSVTRLQGVHCTFDCAGTVTCEEDWRAVHFFRIAQQAIDNAIEHGKAGQIDVRLSSNGTATTLSVSDDGKGMPASALSSTGMGIKIMRYRANALGGELVIENGATAGTVVSCTARNPTHATKQSLS